MDELDYPDDAEKHLLRERHYNATIIKRMDLTEDLARFRIQCDEPVMPFEPGQYVAIGLGNWEPRLRGTQPEDIPIKKSRKLTRRAYSISCPMLHDAESPKAGELAPVDQIDYLEFYITLVRQGATAASKPPALTPRLFGKGEGDRICVERKITGRYLLGDIPADENVLMLGTGTGEAPHNAMATTLLSRGHRGKVVIATSVRYQSDIAYQSFPNYCYLPLTTREPKNLEPNRPDYVGKQYLQTMFTTGKLAELVGDPLAPSNTHVFLCGNPDMIGYVPPGGEVPDRPGMLPLLRAAGFHDATETPGPGTIRFEKYW